MFTELGGITQETGLAFDGVSRLYGSKRGYGTVVTDIEAEGSYRVEMFCDMDPRAKAKYPRLSRNLRRAYPKTLSRRSPASGGMCLPFSTSTVSCRKTLNI